MKQSDRTAVRQLLVAAGWLLFAGTSPAATLYVDGSAKTSGNGSASKPFQSIAPALARAGAGDTITLAPGLYREAVIVNAGGKPDAPLTIRAATPGSVIVTGAVPLTDWRNESDGVFSTHWKTDFAIDFKDGRPVRNHGADAPVGCVEQVIWRGFGLQQVMSRAALPSGAFYVDWATDRLYIKLPGDLDPSKEPIEAAALSALLAAGSDNVADVVIKGITFEHGASFAQRGAVKTGTRWTLEDCTIRFASGCGIMIDGDDVTLRRVICELNGQMGFGAVGAKNATLEECVTRYNNTEGYDAGWEAGGGKFIRTTGLKIRGMRAYGNVGPGLWLDIDNRAYVIESCIAYDNVGQSDDSQGVGIFVEINPGPGRIEGCTAFGNRGAGVMVAECADVTVENNVLVGNRSGVEMRAMPEREVELKNITLRDNQFAGSREAAVLTSLGAWTSASAAGRNIRIERSVFDPAARTPLVRWGTLAINRAADLGRLLGVDRAAVERAVKLPADLRSLMDLIQSPRSSVPLIGKQLKQQNDGLIEITASQRGAVTTSDGQAACVITDGQGGFALLKVPASAHARLDALPVSKGQPSVRVTCLTPIVPMADDFVTLELSSSPAGTR